MVALTQSSRRRAWAAFVLGLAGVATMPAALALAKAWHRIALLDTAFAVPLAFVNALISGGLQVFIAFLLLILIRELSVKLRSATTEQSRCASLLHGS